VSVPGAGGGGQGHCILAGWCAWWTTSQMMGGEGGGAGPCIAAVVVLMPTCSQYAVSAVAVCEETWAAATASGKPPVKVRNQLCICSSAAA
jgi:hypothetical protein